MNVIFLLERQGRLSENTEQDVEAADVLWTVKYQDAKYTKKCL